MNALDWSILIIVVLSVVSALSQGFFLELFSLAGMVVGYLLGSWEYKLLSPKFAPYVKSEAIADMLGFLTIFICVLLLAGVVGRVARWAVKEVGLRWFDRLLGGAFGLLRGAVLVTVAVLAVTAFSPESKFVEQSQLAPYFQVTAKGLLWAAPAEVRQKFHQGEAMIRGLQPKPSAVKQQADKNATENQNGKN